MDAVIVNPLGKFNVGPPDQEWHAFLCWAPDLPHGWTHYAQDDDGHQFRFFWHPLDKTPDTSWHTIFRQAIAEIRTRIRE